MTWQWEGGGYQSGGKRIGYIGSSLRARKCPFGTGLLRCRRGEQWVVIWPWSIIHGPKYFGTPVDHDAIRKCDWSPPALVVLRFLPLLKSPKVGVALRQGRQTGDAGQFRRAWRSAECGRGRGGGNSAPEGTGGPVGCGPHAPSTAPQQGRRTICMPSSWMSSSASSPSTAVGE